MNTMNRVWRPDPGMERCEYEADAELAAEMAAMAAENAVIWAHASGIGEDDAAEAARAALRARAATERAMLADTDAQAIVETAAAWAATETAQEADARVVEAIAAALLAA